MSTDYYSALQLPRFSSLAAIKSQYYQLCLQWHPDKNGNDPAALNRFQDISIAYQALSVPRQKLRYDKLLERHGDQGHDLYLEPEVPVQCYLCGKYFEQVEMEWHRTNQCIHGKRAPRAPRVHEGER